MKFKTGYCFLLLLFAFNQAIAQHIARVDNIKIQSKKLNQEREILVYTPTDYDYRINEFFEVIYVFDSQNREFFDFTSSTISFLTNATKNYIVVGITSPYNKELDYSRNNDLLPVLQTGKSIERYGRYSGNADNFLEYVTTEVIPFINSNYRTLNHPIAVGHSLGASFVLYSLVKKPNTFNNYIAISPNLAYEDEKLSKALMDFDYKKIESFTYLYLSNANEGIDYWEEWKPARKKVHSFLKDVLKEEKIAVEIADYSNNNHWNTFPPSLNNALEYYFTNILEKQINELSKEDYDVTIRVKVPTENDTVYITGNQSNLGEWNPGKIQMQKVSEYHREITLTLRSPAQFKFTRGDWDTEAVIKGTYGNAIIKPELNKEFNFEIQNYFDGEE
ncbi:esterase [Litoribacter alkaliphilus]|uniref:Esterase n=1 Tax=Litoribacter ruber TaxID=702568 RepID=A0AAP2CL16_9BACT|nr:alpha/beta hydrolase-fold protein [Litoribacter alkaliphilus]MBS9525674.1 esterase [Litoribacter alkaliphilus]